MMRRARLWSLVAVAATVVTAAKAAPSAPLTFVWPTGVEVERGGTLLVVENGTGHIERVDPVTGHHAVVATIAHAYRTSAAAAGLFVSANDSVWRISSGGAKRKVVDASEAGPIASAANGDVYFTADGGVFRLVGGTGPARRLAGTASLQGSHGIAVAGDGVLLVSDTEHDRVLRIALPAGTVSTLARVAARAASRSPPTDRSTSSPPEQSASCTSTRTARGSGTSARRSAIRTISHSARTARSTSSTRRRSGP
jgi:hypothetical protein